ncbi:NAD(P)/FAD-dependent oxidoreductase [Herbiconiux sp. L3-i23]|uniref:NAD(P)/FAD-dependent oxidoreductase n=1 Tax=Herbiconiux sp. L3-i23 TaxID=2905871 RepID=UPI0020589FE2|nr:NAD(P)/FAD-dependent oxidoreductase [Herbiconiux sp. L3-i23]BDI23266.1 pyridine nucleotide-disulfide oxidoreductase [Herbiconiux sp. L3-i23]
MTRYDYLIVGGGMVAAGAVHGIRERDQVGTVGVISADVDPPYTRPALSKKLWTDDEFGRDQVPLDLDNTAVDLVLETVVTSIDPGAHTVTTAAGDSHEYGRLLVATGGTPRELDGLPASDRVFYFRSFDDYRHLRTLAADAPHVAVVGGGYIGSELAAALVQNGCRVTLVTPDEVLGASTFPAELAARYERLFTDAGVELRRGTRVESGSESADGVRLDLGNAGSLDVDAVVVGLGIDPVTGILEEAGIETDDGVIVDARLSTSAADVFAAGDIASYPDRILGRRRVEHVDNANEQGPVVGRIMAGSNETYDHTPYYYSAVFGERYEAVGTIDGSLTVRERWSENGTRGVVYYLDGADLVGVLLWNLSDDDDPSKRDDARAVLSDPDAGADPDLESRISLD